MRLTIYVVQRDALSAAADRERIASAFNQLVQPPAPTNRRARGSHRADARGKLLTLVAEH